MTKPHSLNVAVLQLAYTFFHDTDALSTNDTLIQSDSVTNSADAETLVFGGCVQAMGQGVATDERGTSDCSARNFQQARCRPDPLAQALTQHDPVQSPRRTITRIPGSFSLEALFNAPESNGGEPLRHQGSSSRPQ